MFNLQYKRCKYTCCIMISIISLIIIFNWNLKFNSKIFILRYFLVHHWLGIFEFSPDIKNSMCINSPDIFFLRLKRNNEMGFLENMESVASVTQVNHRKIAVNSEKEKEQSTTETILISVFVIFIINSQFHCFIFALSGEIIFILKFSYFIFYLFSS